jgi:hypothetical protein
LPLLLQTNSVTLHELQQLAELVRLGLAASGLEVDPLGDHRVTVNVVTALDSVQLEAEGLNEALGVFESDVAQLAMGESIKELPGVHRTPP